jgi:hypothetical protein
MDNGRENKMGLYLGRRSEISDCIYHFVIYHIKGSTLE